MTRPLPPRQAMILRQLHLAYPDGLVAFDLEQRLHVSQGAIWAPCQKLLRKGCITTEKTSPGPRGSKPSIRYIYSPAGVALMNAMLSSLIAQPVIPAAPAVGVRRVVSPMRDSDVHTAEKRLPKPYSPRPGSHAAGLVELLQDKPEGMLIREIVSALGTPETNLYHSIGRLLKNGYVRREKVPNEHTVNPVYRYFIGDRK